ncbi:MipA/OmpV family protein [Sphingomonas sp. RS2018]
MIRTTIIVLSLLSTALPAAAQERDDRPRRTRVALGPQLVPRYPGADSIAVRPYIDFARARGDTPFVFEAPDESSGFALKTIDGFSFGPAIGFEGKRRRRDTGPGLAEVGFTVELGGFVQAQLTRNVRARVEARQGLGGHRGLIGMVGVDYVARDGDRNLTSLGPRLTLAGGRYNRAYFGVTPGEVAGSGLPAFRPGGGLQAVGVTASHLRQLSGRWGVVGYAKYDRLVDDAARSPVVRAYGSRNQISGGVALSYTFGG